MELIHFKIDDSMYPIARRKIYTIFGIEVWSKSYVMQMIGQYAIWTDDNGNALNEVSKCG